MAALSDFDEVVKNAKFFLIPPHLRAGKVVTVKLGPKGMPHLQFAQPWARSGTYAVAYKFNLPDGSAKALRFFLGPFGVETRQRYTALSRLLAAHASHFTAAFQFHEQGTKTRDGQIHPMVEMDWVEGKTLSDEVESLCKASDLPGLERLCNTWRTLIREMAAVNMAHGDLCADNVLVRPNGSLMLIDYDGVYFPNSALVKFPPGETGIRAINIPS